MDSVRTWLINMPMFCMYAPNIGGKASWPGSGGTRAREGLAGGDVELGAMHGAGDVDPVERTQFERRIHVTTTPLDGVVGFRRSCTRDLFSVEVDGLHPGRARFWSARMARRNWSPTVHILLV